MAIGFELITVWINERINEQILNVYFEVLDIFIRTDKTVTKY